MTWSWGKFDDGLAFAMKSIGIEGEVIGWLKKVGERWRKSNLGED